MKKMMIIVRTKGGLEKIVNSLVQRLENGELVAGYCGHCYYFSMEEGIFVYKQ